MKTDNFEMFMFCLLILIFMLSVLFISVAPNDKTELETYRVQCKNYGYCEKYDVKESENKD